MKTYSSISFWGLAMILSVLGGCRDNKDAIIHPANDSILTVTKEPETFYTYRCEDGYRFRLQLKQNHVVLMLSDRQFTLPQVASGSQSKYSNGRTTFLSENQEAMVEVNNKRHLHCQEAGITHTNNVLKFR